ncbi:hypothetical protein [Streptomyces sp. 3211]|uniref:hypothetical protein n=1 Tax=Streptomyces sp. 3211 TaxID=1964449 RepID=UPI0009A516C5|nr:hypothetical protein [Streptomyces sp. 3211]
MAFPDRRRRSSGRFPGSSQRLSGPPGLHLLGSLAVRIIECEITVATPPDAASVYRLATTLLDARQDPAFDLVDLYHERWEVDSAYFEIKKSMIGR